MAYESVQTLILSWEDESKRGKEEILYLAQVLECEYFFEVQTYAIPHKSSSSTVKSKIDKLVANCNTGKKKHLLIIAYVGHGFRKEPGSPLLIRYA